MFQPFAIALLGLAACAAVGGAAAQTPAEETATQIIADQVRAQGHSCDAAEGAERDTQASKPDDPVWLLRCSNATYRVRLIPDMRATIERIE